VYKSLYLTLVKRARLANSSSGIVDLPEEVLIPSYPENQAELEHYLWVIVVYKLIEPQARKKYVELVRLTFSDKW
jgi:hypothetical protein